MIYSHTLGIGATLCEPLTRVRTLAISTLLQHKHVITLLQKYFPPRVKNILVAGMHNFPNRRGRRRAKLAGSTATAWTKLKMRCVTSAKVKVGQKYTQHSEDSSKMNISVFNRCCVRYNAPFFSWVFQHNTCGNIKLSSCHLSVDLQDTVPHGTSSI